MAGNVILGVDDARNRKRLALRRRLSCSHRPRGQAVREQQSLQIALGDLLTRLAVLQARRVGMRPAPHPCPTSSLARHGTACPEGPPLPCLPLPLTATGRSLRRGRHGASLRLHGVG
ncbi:hypothetical protein E2C01_004359 [Portunus trituberculatus]|uniref:Uncharacterized protein n=1 Tax=Portunus trituberculatus TaxID=210409 RepID=A0A5B7CTU6_PORTR|nr:hypothetical protein [Portunus trituberculatus]